MPSEVADLATKLEARADWCWSGGMNPCRAGEPPDATLRYRGAGGGPAKGSGWIPNLLDDATCGILLGRVRMGPDDSLYRFGRGWRLRLEGRLLAGMSLGEVAAKALLLERP